MERNEHHCIYSIGHGSRPIEEFISILKKNCITYLIDVRSRPFSRFHPQYNRDTLTALLQNENIKYVFMGDTLGGRPEDRDCYDNDSRVDYIKVREKAYFKQGIARLETAYKKRLNVACMCSELSACDCHRSKLIGETLKNNNISLIHIEKNGELITQDNIINKILLKKNNFDLFDNTDDLINKSVKSYRK
ncbi:DUF488 domain-containing protein [Aeromonas caviae]|uniref:DUF488 domain-containing protein n=1 Tax=Aeromonas caviae TaxID=648 RepID=UPI0021E0C8B7|nr:DUF488 domain-containing protein [Aeromonas caviae]MCU9924489.1 DUF488 domain-containing protein [Aeromonas caviae]